VSKRVSGRGLSVAGRPSSRRSLTVYEELQRDIMLGDIPPLATILELDVAERFGCSQSTAREALIALDHDGLVDRRPHRGTFVAGSRADDASELIQVRRDIECRGVPRVLENYTDQLHTRLQELIQSMISSARSGDAYQLSLLDREFHLELYDAADMPSVQPILRRCLIHNHRFKILNSKEFNDLVETAERHEAIVDALKSGNVDSVKAVLSHHITTIVEFGPSVLADV
jgi:GntR family transcriptional regulator, rspAB operon transcriptional repressor